MADTTAISKELVSVLQEVKNAARSMAQATEKLSNSGLERFTSEVKKSLKLQGLINDEDAKYIKTAEDLQKVLGGLEDKFSAISAIEKEAALIKKKALAAAKGNAAKLAKAERANKDLLEAKLKEIGLTEEMAATIKASIPGLRDEAATRLKLIAAGDGLTKSYETQRKALIENVKSFGTFKNALAEAGKAYNIMQRATAKGMLGTLGIMTNMAFKLSISASDLEDIMAKNHTAINQMGGGLEGMQKFGDELGNIREDLKFLGEGATKASARMYEYSKRAGLQQKNGVAYEKNMKETNKQMISFMGNFGDTAESYGALMDGLNEEAVNRGILNNLTSEEILLNQKEQRSRVENLKFMGLNNQEILDMNKRLNDLNNNSSGQIVTRASEALNFKTAIQADIDLMMKSSDISDQQRGKELKENQIVLNKMADLFQGRQMEALKTLQESDKGRNAAASLSKVEQAKLKDRFAGDAQYGVEFSRRLMDNAPTLKNNIVKNGDAFANAEGRGDYTKPEDRAAVSKKNEDITAAKGSAADILDIMTKTAKGVEAVMNNIFIATVAGAAAAAFALAGAAGKAAWALNKIGGLPGIPGSGPGAPGGTSSKIPGKGLKIGGATVASAVIGLGADYAADKLGRDTKAGAGADVLSSAASGAGLGALALGWTGIGAPIGAAIGGTLGAGYGLYQNRDILFKSSNPATVTSPTNSAATPAAATGGKAKSGSNVDQFVSKYGAAAEAAGKKLGVDPKIILGQWGLETGWGKSVIPGTNNLGNIKDFSGKGVTAKDNMNGSVDKYRAYGSPEAFADDYVSLIQRKYPGAVGAGSPEAFARALKSGGYAEDPNYVKSVSTAARMAGASTTSGSAPSMPVMPNMTPAAAPVAAPSGTSVSSSGSGGASGSEAITELKKQTGLLSTIAQTLGVSPSPAPNRNGYARDTAVVMSGVHG